jgi:uncharacterized protein (TIGR02145 family)
MKQAFLFTLLLLQSFLSFTQAPNKMSYQAVIRNSNNTVVSNHAVGMRISILQGTATGISVYTETQSPTTNTNGLIAIEIGTGTIISGSFANIDWANSPYFVKTETDPNGGSNYTLTGTSQLLSVPYALYAKNGLPSGGQNGQSITICDGEPTWTFNGQCPAKISAFNFTDTVHLGIITSNFPATNCKTSISYLGGNGGIYGTQTIASTGVTGLTATLNSGVLNSGNGMLELEITGTPNSKGIAFFVLKIGNTICTLSRKIIDANVLNLNCYDTIHYGDFTSSISANGRQTLISYTGGNGANYDIQSIPSSGVLGLTAVLNSGKLNLGDGILNLIISGTPNSAGVAYFNLNIGSKNCTIQRIISQAPTTGTWSTGTFFCNGTPTAIVNVTNPYTGKTWMDRNLGASRAATNSSDTLACGDLYQWGRPADGHQCRTSIITTTYSSVDQPEHSNFIILPNYPNPNDWRVPQNNNLWQGVNGLNNPCPNGYRLPTIGEFYNEVQSWSSKNIIGAYTSPLKLTTAGRRGYNGPVGSIGVEGAYWTSSYDSPPASRFIYIYSSDAMMNWEVRASGLSVRCIKN